MSVDYSHIAWPTAQAVWVPGGYRLEVCLHRGLSKRLLAEARLDLKERLEERIGIRVENLEVVEGSNDDLGFIGFQTEGRTLFQVSPEVLGNAIESAFKSAATRLADQIAFEKAAGNEWLKRLRER